LKIYEKWVVKSGTDFRELSLIELTLDDNTVLVDKIEKYVVDSKIPEKDEIKDLVNSYLGFLIFYLFLKLNKI
jgi:hypothetical protein